jgi:hypothetical protein
MRDGSREGGMHACVVAGGSVRGSIGREKVEREVESGEGRLKKEQIR